MRASIKQVRKERRETPSLAVKRCDPKNLFVLMDHKIF